MKPHHLQLEKSYRGERALKCKDHKKSELEKQPQICPPPTVSSPWFPGLRGSNKSGRHVCASVGLLYSPKGENVRRGPPPPRKKDSLVPHHASLENEGKGHNAVYFHAGKAAILERRGQNSLCEVIDRRESSTVSLAPRTSFSCEGRVSSSTLTY